MRCLHKRRQLWMQLRTVIVRHGRGMATATGAIGNDWLLRAVVRIVIA